MLTFLCVLSIHEALKRGKAGSAEEINIASIANASHSQSNSLLSSDALREKQFRHKIGNDSVAGTVVVCIIGTAELIFGLCKHTMSTF